MPDENQSTTNPSTTDNAATTASSTTTDADIDMSGIDPNLTIPSLEDLEYATPSAYIDPDLPSVPTSIDAVEEPKEETPEEETIEMTPEQIADAIKASNSVMSSVAEKIADSRNILIALSSDPSIDELASAIALSLFLDRLGKHAIAIYSGTIPSALEFLSPAECFEKNADVLQDFVVSLSKDKADHLRYKLEGDFVKVFITPYKDRITSEDLEFSYGDYNVDLVLALNVNNGIDLDNALREYGTIMRDAMVVNITTGNPGKFGETEWSNKFASSVSEMVSGLLLGANGDTRINDKEATALLTGIVAATDRFAKANTFPGTMQVASKLMDAGANQQVVAANISDDLDNQFFTFSETEKENKKGSESDSEDDLNFSFEPKEEPEDKLADDSTALRIAHGEAKESEDSTEESTSESKSTDTIEPTEPSEPTAKSSEPTTIEPAAPEVTTPEPTPLAPAAPATDPGLLDELKATEASLSNVGAETVINPDANGREDATSKYGQMLEAAIAAPATPVDNPPMDSSLPPIPNPAATSAPAVEATPEISGMPDINYGQTMDDQLLPPPPTPPVDMDASLPLPTPTDLPPAPDASMPPTPTAPSAPDTFAIPGM